MGRGGAPPAPAARPRGVRGRWRSRPFPSLLERRLSGFGAWRSAAAGTAGPSFPATGTPPTPNPIRSEKVGPGLHELKRSLAFHCGIPISTGNAPSSVHGWLNLRVSRTQLIAEAFAGTARTNAAVGIRSHAAPCWTGLEGRPRNGGTSLRPARSPEEPSTADPVGVWSCP